MLIEVGSLAALGSYLFRRQKKGGFANIISASVDSYSIVKPRGGSVTEISEILGGPRILYLLQKLSELAVALGGSESNHRVNPL